MPTARAGDRRPVLQPTVAPSLTVPTIKGKVPDMNQAISGVSPPELGETTVMTVWPSIAATGMGRFIGRLCSNQTGFGFFTLGKLLALACIPLALPIFFFMLLPGVSRRYRLTNRRLIVHRWLTDAVDKAISLDDFDSIEVVTRPGQQWYPAGDLVFRKGPVEVFQLSGVPRPEVFRQNCLKTRLAFISVRRVVGDRQLASA